MPSHSKNLQILYEDNHLIILNKRVGDIVQGDKTGDIPLSEFVKQYLAEKYNKPGAAFLGVVHRIDRPTSGIVIFAKTSKALSRLNKMLVDKTIQKTYWAVVQDRVELTEDTLVNYLRKNEKNNKASVYDTETEGTKKAVLHYKVIKYLDKYTLLEIDLETGRHHQIRSQLAHLGHPVRGDVKYGFKRPNADAGIHLHARRLSLVHPVSKELLEIEAPLPEDPVWKICQEN
jgi:23S rRNA pseudouridine1911/1915/1917 synthase